MIELTELFHSLQGEGPFAGKPAVFVRLSRCIPPLCPWCDTQFAWQAGTMIDVDILVAKILAFGCKFVVITGGEPFLQWSSGLNNLEKTLIEHGCFIQYETSGKLSLPDESQGFIVCSPKFLDNSWQFVGPNCLAANAFKFVVEDDFQLVDNFIEKWKIPAEKVWIMPLGASREEQLQHFTAIWNYCVKRGFTFSPRLHTLAFDNKKGV